MERGLLFGNSGSRRIQLIRRLVGFADCLLQLRRSAFLVCKLQTGGWTVIGRRTLPVGLAPFPALFLFTFMDTPVIQPLRCAVNKRSGIAGGRIVLLRRTVGHPACLACDHVDGDGPVTGHLLRFLLSDFPFLHASPPAFP